MEDMILNTELKIKIFKSLHQKDPIAAGSCFPFKDFLNFLDERDCQISSSNVYCFTGDELKRNLEADITNSSVDRQAPSIPCMRIRSGLKRDYKVRLNDGLKVYKQKGVFYPDIGFYNSDPLPEDWLQIVKDSQNQSEINQQNNNLANPAISSRSKQPNLNSSLSTLGAEN
jgi:hypothetical protein